MKKAVFTNKIFYWFSITFFSLLFSLNILATIITHKNNFIAHVLLASCLIVLLTKNKSSKIILQVYGCIISISCVALLLVNYALHSPETNTSTLCGIQGFAILTSFILIGIFIFIGATKTIKIESIEDQ